MNLNDLFKIAAALQTRHSCFQLRHAAWWARRMAHKPSTALWSGPWWRYSPKTCSLDRSKDATWKCGNHLQNSLSWDSLGCVFLNFWNSSLGGSSDVNATDYENYDTSVWCVDALEQFEFRIPERMVLTNTMPVKLRTHSNQTSVSFTDTDHLAKISIIQNFSVVPP